ALAAPIEQLLAIGIGRIAEQEIGQRRPRAGAIARGAEDRAEEQRSATVDIVKAVTAEVASDFESVIPARDAQVVGVLERVPDREIRIAAADARELGRAANLS